MTNPLHPYKTLQFLLAFFLSLAGFNRSMAQGAGADSLAAAFNRHPDRWLQEKLFLHVDKTFYLAGEIIWFKAYDVDARDNTPLSISGIAYVELLDRDQKAVLQSRIELNNGSGNGSFRIPSSIATGHYTFRAYTSWMKNFSPDFYFHQQLTVLNTLNNEAPVDSPAPGIPSSAIRFFPEGGNMVNGVPSEVAFKATDRFDNGIPCSGTIIDQQKDTVARFTANRFGMGHFTFTPVRGNKYIALVTAPDGSLTEKLPDAFDQGMVMHLDESDAHHLRITVRSASMAADPTVYLFVHTRHRIRSIEARRLEANQTAFVIDKDSLDDGISHITLFTAARTPVCERLFCKQPARRLHIDVNSAPSATTSAATPGVPTPGDPTRASAAPRTKLSFDLTTTDPRGRPVPADLSMSVFLIDSLQSIPGENILGYLLLRSDLKGKIQSPEAYFANSDPETLQALDDLMLTQGWTRFRWEDILHDKQPVFEFLPESDGPIIHARLLDKATGRPPAPQIGYLSVPGRQFRLSTALSREDGSLNFHVDRFYGNREVILQTHNPADSNYRIDVSNPFSDRFPSAPDAGAPLRTTWKNQVLDRSIAVQAENAYRVSDKYHLLPAPGNDTLGFYGTADRQYNLDDYTRFVTMDEVIREFVDNVKVRSQSGKTVFRVRNALFNLFFEDDPLLLIDGVPVFSGEKVLALNPLRIRKIDVVSHRYYLGPSITDGIVSLRSYDGDLGGYQLDPGAVVVQFNGLQENREFYSPVYESAAQVQSPLPDLRNQLLWRPDVPTDSGGKGRVSLYTSDMTGTFAVVVQGLSGDGLAGYAVRTFRVAPASHAKDPTGPSNPQ